jgi:excinuclease ABC subunit B
VPLVQERKGEYLSVEAIPKQIQDLKKEMKQAAEHLEFEKAAEIRDRIRELEQREIGLTDPLVARSVESEQ